MGLLEPLWTKVTIGFMSRRRSGTSLPWFSHCEDDVTVGVGESESWVIISVLIFHIWDVFLSVSGGEIVILD